MTWEWNSTFISQKLLYLKTTLSSELVNLPIIVSLLCFVKVDMSTLGTPYEKNLDQAYHPFRHFYLNYHTKFLYSLFNTFILNLS